MIVTGDQKTSFVICYDTAMLPTVSGEGMLSMPIYVMAQLYSINMAGMSNLSKIIYLTHNYSGNLLNALYILCFFTRQTL